MENIRINEQLVDIDLIQPNAFNPKKSIEESEENKNQFIQIKKSITNHGLNDLFLVREIENGKFELIDGFHRWAACKELGIKKVKVNNLGKISDIEAKKRLLFREKAKIPVDFSKEALLVKDIYEAVQDVNVMVEQLPYDSKLIESKLELVDFDWEAFEKNNQKQTKIAKEAKPEEEKKEVAKYIFRMKLKNDDHKKLKEAMAKVGGYSRENSLLKLCKSYPQVAIEPDAKV